MAYRMTAKAMGVEQRRQPVAIAGQAMPGLRLPGRVRQRRRRDLAGRGIGEVFECLSGLGQAQVAGRVLEYSLLKNAHPLLSARLAILAQLRGGEKCACVLLEQLDIGQPGLEDPRVRQALNYAIDREGIVALMNGLAMPAKGQVDASSPWFGKPTFEAITTFPGIKAVA